MRLSEFDVKHRRNIRRPLLNVTLTGRIAIINSSVLVNVSSIIK